MDRTRLIGLDWDFNAYGGEKEGCYWPCDKDKALCGNMCKAVAKQYGIKVETRKVPMILEGGSIHTDGEGTVMATMECLLNKNRNPSMTKEEIEAMVTKSLGCTKMIWLPHGVANDEDTNGHVDNWCMFARPGEVILSWCDDPTDENYTRCRESMEVLEKETDAKGRKFKVIKLPPPPPMVSQRSAKRRFSFEDLCQRTSSILIVYVFLLANYSTTRRKIPRALLRHLPIPVSATLDFALRRPMSTASSATVP